MYSFLFLKGVIKRGCWNRVEISVETRGMCVRSRLLRLVCARAKVRSCMFRAVEAGACMYLGLFLRYVTIPTVTSGRNSGNNIFVFRTRISLNRVVR